MLVIHKGKEPHSLYQEKCQGVQRYDDLKTETKEDIRENLLKEQGYLCAYCMRRIHGPRDMKIEHYHAQNPEAGERNDKSTIDYNNMLAVCLGNEGRPFSFQTCDSHKGNTDITVNPFLERSIEQIKYQQGDGLIYSDDQRINRDLDITLNLNSERTSLKENRKEVLRSLQQKIKRDLGSSKGTKDYWQRLYKWAQMKQNGQKKEYAGILLWYISRKMQKAE